MFRLGHADYDYARDFFVRTNREVAVRVGRRPAEDWPLLFIGRGAAGNNFGSREPGANQVRDLPLDHDIFLVA